MKYGVRLSSLVFVLMFSANGIVLANYNTFHHENFSSPCEDFSWQQWTNYYDWKDEMNDITSCYYCSRDESSLWHYIARNGDYSYIGLNADLLAIDSHGAGSGSGTAHRGYVYNKKCQTIDMSSIEPPNMTLDIFLIHACNAYTLYNYDNWHAFRNMHRYGASVAAGCYGICHIADTIVNTTWNEIGDEIADSRSTIATAWENSMSIELADDDIIVVGVGWAAYPPPYDCNTRAMKTSYQNRESMTGPTYDRNEPWPYYVGDPEMCGHYWSNW